MQVCVYAHVHKGAHALTHTHTLIPYLFFLFCKGINLACLREINWKAGGWGHQEKSEQGEGDLDKGGEWLAFSALLKSWQLTRGRFWMGNG